MYDLIVKNGTIINYNQHPLVADIAIKDAKIVEIGQDLSGSKQILDASNLQILPGLIDTQVHFREPGLTHKEDLASGSKAAVLGGICTFFEMPNTKPATITLEKIEEKIAIAKKKSLANFAFYIGASEDNLEELLKIENLDGCCGVKIFLGSSTGDLLLYKKEVLLKIFQTIKVPIAVHSESEVRLNERLSIRDGATSVHAHYEWRDATSAIESTKMIIEIAKQAKRKVHILHISTKDEMEFLKTQKDHCTVEATPQHLTLFAPDAYDSLGTFAQMNPPIRTKDHTEGIWRGLHDGTVDVIGSDHAPHTKKEKANEYPNSPSGMPGVQTTLPLLLHHMENKRIDLNKIIELMAVNPSKIFGLNKGSIEVGKDADLTIIDLNESWMIKNEDQASKCGWTPFYGMNIKGRPKATVVSGHIAMLENQTFKAQGQAVKFDR